MPGRFGSVLRRHIFGLRTDIKNGVHFVNQSVVAFVAGHNVVLHSMETRSQSFLPGVQPCRAQIAVDQPHAGWICT